MKYARKLIKFLSDHRESLSPLLILTHDYPDPDALAGAFALHHLAENFYGIRTRISYGGIIGRMENRAMASMLRMPIHKLKPSDLKKFENVALIDTQPNFGNNSFPKNRRASIVIDQHPSVVKPLADLAIVDPETGATCVILAQALLLLGVEIPVRVATALAYGILSDTLNLYRAKRPDIIQTYMEILPYCDMRILARIQNPSRSRRFFTTLGKGIWNAEVRQKLILSHLGAVENPDLVSQVADFLLTYKGIDWSLTTGRYNNKLYVSLRVSKPTVDACDILRDVFVHRGKAGGHDTIAGGSFEVGKNPSEDQWREAEVGLGVRLLKRLRLRTRGKFHAPFKRINPSCL